MSLFGVFFVGNSFPIGSAHFTQVDPTHWVLDVCTLVKPQYWELKEVALFLNAPGTLDPSMALGLYLKLGDSEWLYRGCVHNGHPSEVMPLQWPTHAEGFTIPPLPGVIQLGVSIEPLSELSVKEGSRLGDKLMYGRRVGMDLYRYLTSFATQNTGSHMVVPTSLLERWLQRFETKFKLDPDFLTRKDEDI